MNGGWGVDINLYKILDKKKLKILLTNKHFLPGKLLHGPGKLFGDLTAMMQTPAKNKHDKDETSFSVTESPCLSKNTTTTTKTTTTTYLDIPRLTSGTLATWC